MTRGGARLRRDLKYYFRDPTGERSGYCWVKECNVDVVEIILDKDRTVTTWQPVRNILSLRDAEAPRFLISRVFGNATRFWSVEHGMWVELPDATVLSLIDRDATPEISDGIYNELPKDLVNFVRIKKAKG